MEIKILTLYSIQNQQTAMFAQQEILIQQKLNSTIPQGSKQVVGIKYLSETFDFNVIISDLCRVSFQRFGKVFSINLSSKMESKYSQTSNDPIIQSLIFFINNREITLTSKEEGLLQKIYGLLKKIISHRGFNEIFKPLKRLGRGSFAAVYLVEHKYTKQRLAAKVFSRQGQKVGFKGQEALENEIKMLKLLNHPNIISFQGIFETENLIYVVTEYLSGGTLQDFMRNKMDLGDFITKIISDTLSALSYLQQNHIMHRDLKPENIIMRQSNKSWVIADFGLAAFTNETYLYDKCGTMGYIAPQILAENDPSKTYSYACDLYSLGVMSYKLIVGSLPFKVESQGMFEKKVIWNAFNTSDSEDLDRNIVDLLKGLLEKDPQKRLTPKQALSMKFFTDPQVIKNWKIYNQKNVQQSYNKILRLKNGN